MYNIIMILIHEENAWLSEGLRPGLYQATEGWGEEFLFLWTCIEL